MQREADILRGGGYLLLRLPSAEVLGPRHEALGGLHLLSGGRERKEKGVAQSTRGIRGASTEIQPCSIDHTIVPGAAAGGPTSSAAFRTPSSRPPASRPVSGRARLLLNRQFSNVAVLLMAVTAPPA